MSFWGIFQLQVKEAVERPSRASWGCLLGNLWTYYRPWGWQPYDPE